MVTELFATPETVVQADGLKLDEVCNVKPVAEAGQESVRLCPLSTTEMTGGATVTEAPGILLADGPPKARSCA